MAPYFGVESNPKVPLQDPAEDTQLIPSTADWSVINRDALLAGPGHGTVT